MGRVPQQAGPDLQNLGRVTSTSAGPSFPDSDGPESSAKVRFTRLGRGSPIRVGRDPLCRLPLTRMGRVIPLGSGWAVAGHRDLAGPWQVTGIRLGRDQLHSAGPSHRPNQPGSCASIVRRPTSRAPGRVARCTGQASIHQSRPTSIAA